MSNLYKIILISLTAIITVVIVYYSLPHNTEEPYSTGENWVEVDLPYSFKNKEAENLSAKAFNLRKESKFNEAIKIYDQAIQIEPDNPRLYFDVSVCYARKHLLKIAIQKLDTAIMLDSTYLGFYNNRGFFHYQLREDVQAIADLQKAIQLDNPSPDIYYNLSIVYYANNRLDDACNMFNQAKRLGLDIDHVKQQNEYKQLTKSCK
jgi:tetratricopeptide (TPR) repeat protein